MELYVQGVDVPKLGSPKDVVLRQYLVKNASKEIYKNKLLTYIALALAGQNKESSKISGAITSTWNDYINLELFMENDKEQQEIDMRGEYEFWRKVMPKVNIGKDGKITVSGIPKL